MWYAIQVTTGREDAARDMVELVGNGILDECFVLRYRMLQRLAGEWTLCTETMFPGYLIVSTDHVKELERALPKHAAFANLLKVDGSFIPLNEEEVAWIDGFTRKGSRIIEISLGCAEKGGKVTITEGPLVGHEDWIKKISSHKKLAYLEIPMFGQTISTQVGLKVVRKRAENPMENRAEEVTQ